MNVINILKWCPVLLFLFFVLLGLTAKGRGGQRTEEECAQVFRSLASLFENGMHFYEGSIVTADSLLDHEKKLIDEGKMSISDIRWHRSEIEHYNEYRAYVTKAKEVYQTLYGKAMSKGAITCGDLNGLFFTEPVWRDLPDLRWPDGEPVDPYFYFLWKPDPLKK